MRKSHLMMQMCMGIALAFAVQTPAQAQFGGLVKKAKKAVGVSDNNSSSNDDVTAKAQADYAAAHPAVQEKNNVEKAGGMDKYLGLDQTENGRILWKWASVEDYTKNYNVRNAYEAARQLTFILRYLKGNTEEFSAHAQPAYVLDMVNNQIPANIKRAQEKKGATSEPISKADADALTSECARIKQLYMSQTGTKEKSAEEKQAEANAECVKSIVDKNYLLNDLTDKNRNAKAVADYKAKINAKVKSALAPTKILGTYSTSFAWQGLPVFTMPEYKDEWSSIQEMQFKTFYEKGGKYYVVKSAFRQSIDKGDNKSGAQPQKFYWPGIETPVEIPADKIQGKF